MSDSTDAYLFYGMCLLSSDSGMPDWFDTGRDEWVSFYDALQPKRNVIEETYGCYLDTHCCDDDPILFLAAEKPTYNGGSNIFTLAWRGEPQRITELPDTTGLDAKLKAAADYLGWPEEKRNIGWWLASYWG